MHAQVAAADNNVCYMGGINIASIYNSDVNKQQVSTVTFAAT